MYLITEQIGSMARLGKREEGYVEEVEQILLLFYLL